MSSIDHELQVQTYLCSHIGTSDFQDLAEYVKETGATYLSQNSDGSLRFLGNTSENQNAYKIYTAPRPDSFGGVSHSIYAEVKAGHSGTAADATKIVNLMQYFHDIDVPSTIRYVVGASISSNYNNWQDIKLVEYWGGSWVYGSAYPTSVNFMNDKNILEVQSVIGGTGSATQFRSYISVNGVPITGSTIRRVAFGIEGKSRWCLSVGAPTIDGTVYLDLYGFGFTGGE
jgi:hypothetical protein